MRFLVVSAACLSVVVCVQAENFLQQGDFAGGSAGGPPLDPWSTGKTKPGISVLVENPPGEGGEKNWVHVVDESGEDAAGLVQKFNETASGRLEFKLHVVKSGAAIWFLLGRKEVSGKGDLALGFKISSKGYLLVSTDNQKVADTSGSKASFAGGQTYDLYCDFKPTADQSGMEIEIGQKDGGVLFKGVSTNSASRISALAIRTHGEELGSDFYVTDLVLGENPSP